MLLVVFLRGGEETVDPLAVISVKNHRHAIQLGDLVHVFGSGDGASDRYLVIGVVNRLSGDDC